MDFLINTAAFLVALGIIIFAHEGGHLLMGKAFDMRTLAFSLGFGKRLFGFKRGETDYRVSLVPLGGYVSFGGEDPGSETGDPRDFQNKPRWQRIIVFIAGPLMNIVLAIALIAAIFMIGAQVSALSSVPAVVGDVAPDSPAAAAGLQVGDQILSIDGKKASSWEEVNFAVLTSPGRDLDLVLNRNGVEESAVVTPVKVPRYEFGDAGMLPKMMPNIKRVNADGPADAAGFEVGDELRRIDGRAISGGNDFVKYIEEHADQSVVVSVLRDGQLVDLLVTPSGESGVGKIGVELAFMFQKFPPGKAIVESVKFNWQVTKQTFQVLGKIVSGKMAAKSALSGPLEIAAMSGAAVRSSWTSFIQLMGLLSISIAILNLLPIPVLDGGQITVLLIESIRRRDLSLKLKERIMQVGFVLIMMLMGLVLYFDIVKNLPTG